MTQNMNPHQPATPRGQAGSGSPQPSIAELISRIGDNLVALVRGEIDLTKAKLKRTAAAMGLGLGLIVVAAVLALYALGFLLAAGAQALAIVLPMWAAHLVVGAILLIIVAVLLALGVKQIQAGTKEVPNPQETISRDLDAARDAIQSGLKKGSEK